MSNYINKMGCSNVSHNVQATRLMKNPEWKINQLGVSMKALQVMNCDGPPAIEITPRLGIR